MSALLPLPAQPAAVAWPTGDWPTGEPGGADPDGLLDAVDAMFVEPAPEELGHTHALLIVQGGRLVVERYGTRFVGELERLAGVTPEPITAATPHISWSMAKSVLHAVVGVLVGQGRIDVSAPVPVPAWQGPDDPRQAITWDDLLAMRPGLAWVEEYYEFAGGTVPDVVTMLFGDGRHDMAAFAAGFPLVHRPGSPEAYCYSSGTSNIVSAAVGRVVGGGEAGMRAFLDAELFEPLGMTTAEPSFDHAGTFVASSYLDASARDFARFGLLYLRDGMWDGRRLLPEGWVDHGRLPRSIDEDAFHGAHWWAEGGGSATFSADGFESQRILVVPDRDVIVVRLGKTHTDHRATLDAHLDRIASCC